jgi:alpha-L-fucosidase 2
MGHTLAIGHFLVALVLVGGVAPAADGGPTLWYDKPAADWEREALPIGNGRLGSMVFGTVEKERLQFNEDSLWVGDEDDTGSYQAFGDVFVELGHKGATKYRRELDIARAVHTVTYEAGGVNYRRECFASHPANVLVFHFTADKPESHSGAVVLTDAHKGAITVDGNRFTVKGNLAAYTHSLSGGKKKYGIALDYEAQVAVLALSWPRNPATSATKSIRTRRATPTPSSRPCSSNMPAI